MKIREVLDKKVGDVTYNRYILVLPKKIVKDSRLIGKKLKANYDNGKIIIEQE